MQNTMKHVHVASIALLVLVCCAQTLHALDARVQADAAGASPTSPTSSILFQFFQGEPPVITPPKMTTLSGKASACTKTTMGVNGHGSFSACKFPHFMEWRVDVEGFQPSSFEAVMNATMVSETSFCIRGSVTIDFGTYSKSYGMHPPHGSSCVTDLNKEFSLVFPNVNGQFGTVQVTLFTPPPSPPPPPALGSP